MCHVARVLMPSFASFSGLSSTISSSILTARRTEKAETERQRAASDGSQ
jgi:hypothetical protein